MNLLFLVSIAFGLIIVGSRIPLVINTDATMNFIFKVFFTPVRLRIIGVFLAILGYLMVVASQTVDGLFPTIIFYFGCVFLAGIPFIILFPKFMRIITVRAYEYLGPGFFRTSSFVELLVGFVWIYYSIVLFYGL